jgi:trimeric autotransporter adhesin
MYATPTSPQSLRLPHFFTHWIVGFVAALLLVLTGFAAHAAPPPAGTSISNQASASYTDGSNVVRTVTSNVVQTTVLQVASLTLTANGAQNANPGSVTYYPHTLTNTGNGSDTFNLATTNAGGFTMSTVQIFADNGSGQPTGPALTSSGLLPAGAAFKFIVVDTLPATATAGQTNTVTVTATSVTDNTKTAVNTDVTTVTVNAVVTLTKAVSASSGAPGSGPYTYTLTYTNTGNSTATSVAISDVIPAGMTYVLGTAKWSGSVTALSDAGGTSGTSPNTLISSYTAGTKVFLATLAQVTAGQSGTVSFQVNVAAGTAPGNLNNTATTSYNNGAATVTGTSNTVPFNVTQIATATFTGPTATPTAAAGTTVSFANLVTNTGNGTDTFNITLAAGSFPLGTTFQLFKSDGVTPLVDTNGDGIADTGPLAAGATYNVVLKATLPPNAPTTSTPSSVSKTATSVTDPSKTATATDTLLAITGATVDLTNNTAGTGSPGFGPGPGAVAVTNLVNPANTTVFTLVANNTGTTPDSYDLTSNLAANFGGAALPAGWTVTFKAAVGGSCTTTGANITNTGTVQPGAVNAVNVCAVVSVPAGYVAGTTDLYFRVLSSTSGAADILHDAVTVNAVRSISITPPGTGQTYPGGSFVYAHTLTNTGNVLEANGLTTPVSTVALATANNQPGWTSVLYYDANNNGVLDATDPQITSLNAVRAAGLAPGASITVFDKVTAPSGALPGAVDATTITVTTSNGSYVSTVPAVATATDGTTVIAGNLSLTKSQSLDAACAGPVPATVYSGAILSAKPGQCVLYQITATNLGSADATAVVVSDSTPAFTTLSSLAAATVGTVTGPALTATGSISASIGTLAPNASASMTFGVKITP